MITQSNYADYVKLLIDVLNGGGNISDNIVIKADKEINIKISIVDNICRIDFLSPEPKASIHKIVTLTDSIDYIKILPNGKLLLKTRGWAWEIPVEI